MQMKDLSIRKNYCYKIHIFLMKSSAYHLLSTGNPQYGPPSVSTRKSPPLLWFFKFLSPHLNVEEEGGIQIMKTHRKMWLGDITLLVAHIAPHVTFYHFFCKHPPFRNKYCLKGPFVDWSKILSINIFETKHFLVKYKNSFTIQ